MCEDARDVELVRWGGEDRQTVEVTASFGLIRDNDGQSCFERGGKQRRAVLADVQQGSTFEPTDATKSTLLSMAPTPPADEALDPAVRATATYQPRIPSELLPTPHEAHFVDPECPGSR